MTQCSKCVVRVRQWCKNGSGHFRYRYAWALTIFGLTLPPDPFHGCFLFLCVCTCCVRSCSNVSDVAAALDTRCAPCIVFEFALQANSLVRSGDCDAPRDVGEARDENAGNGHLRHGYSCFSAAAAAGESPELSLSASSRKRRLESRGDAYTVAAYERVHWAQLHALPAFVLAESMRARTPIWKLSGRDEPHTRVYRSSRTPAT